MAGLIMHRYVLIILFCFHLPTLADTLLRFSLYFDIFQWRVEYTSHRRLRYTRTREDMCPPLVSVLEPLSPVSQHRPLSTVYGGRQKKADRRAHTARAHSRLNSRIDNRTF